MRRLLALGVLSLLSFPLGPSFAAKKAPRSLAWAMESLDTEAAVPGGASTVTLFDEARVHLLGTGGRRRYQRRLVVRVLTAAGRDVSLHPIYYGQNSTLTSFKAWTIRPDGTVDPFEKKDARDFSLTDAAVYSDARALVLPLRNVGVGSAIAVEFVRDEERFFLQDEWYFQDAHPVVLSRYEVTLPPGWTYEASLLNHPEMEPAVDGNILTWELRNLPGLAVEREPSPAPLADQAARLAISFLPRVGWGGAEEFRSWGDVSAWYHKLVSGQTISDAEIRSTVSRLVEGATTERERIERVGRFVQDVRYVSISLGKSAFRPHKSVDVFQNRYADCKDKTTLMITMLREAGIESHPMLVDTRIDGQVFVEFPSPLQFNHCIIAIPVPENTVENALVIHPDMGDILVFDPTDSMTPVGDLPWTDQGTRALLVHPEHGGLVTLPVLPASMNRADRTWTMALVRSGHATVTVTAAYHGQYGRMMRSIFGGLDDAARLAELNDWLADSAAGARIESVDFQNVNDGTKPFRISAEFRVANFARQVGDLLLVEPFRMARTMVPDVTPEERTLPLMVPFRFAEHDTVRLELPQGFRVSEPPAGDALDGALGRFRLEHREGDGVWEVDRVLEVDALEIGTEAYPAARMLIRKHNDAVRAILVLEPTS